MEIQLVLIVPIVAGLTFLAGFLYEKRQMRLVSYTLMGFFVGGLLGFLLRPSDPFFRGQLPFEVVVTRGSTLEFPLTAAIPLAQTSFNYMLAGTILGGVCGIFLTRFFPGRKVSQQG